MASHRDHGPYAKPPGTYGAATVALGLFVVLAVTAVLARSGALAVAVPAVFLLVAGRAGWRRWRRPRPLIVVRLEFVDLATPAIRRLQAEVERTTRPSR